MPRPIILLLAALAFGGLASWLTSVWLDNEARARVDAAALNPTTVEILVAAQELKPGTRLTPGTVRWAPWPTDAVLPDHLRRDADGQNERRDAVLREEVPAGQPIRADYLIELNGQGLASALLKPGLRAISIAVTQASGLAGLADPGDRVDLILTVPGNPQIPAQTVARNVRVLATDRRTGRGSADEGGSVPATVTLEVSPRLAERIVAAGEIGRLTLALRDLGGAGPAAEEDMGPLPELFAAPVETAEAVSHPASPPAATPAPAPAARPGVQVVRGTRAGAPQ